jgi:hypothetical protein
MRAHLRAWLTVFRRRSRWSIDREDVQAAVDEWPRIGYSPREIRHRVKILAQLFRHFDAGETATDSWCALAARREAAPRQVSIDTIRQVALQLLKRSTEASADCAMRKRVRGSSCSPRPACGRSRWRARTGRLRPRAPYVARPAGEGRPGHRPVPERRDARGRALFIAADAFGEYDRTSFSKTLRRNGWPSGSGRTMRDTPLARRSDAPASTSATFRSSTGHASPATTSGFYLEPERRSGKKLRARRSRAASA